MITLKAVFYSNDRQPIDTLISVKSVKDYTENLAYYRRYAIVKICAEKGWRYSDLIKYGYTKLSMRKHIKQIY